MASVEVANFELEDPVPESSSPQMTSPAALVCRSCPVAEQSSASFNPCDCIWIPANVEVPVAPIAVVWIPPAKVEVAVVVETSEPTVTWEEVAATDVPSNQRSADERRVAFVPPEAIGAVPVKVVNERQFPSMA